MTAPVGGVTSPHEEAALLEWVEELNEGAGIEAHGRMEIGLAHGATVVEQPEQLEVSRREVHGGVGGAQAPHRFMTEEREQETGARATLLEQAATLRLGVGWYHAGVVYLQKQLLKTNNVLPYDITGDPGGIMRAIAVEDFSVGPKLVELPVPEPGRGEVLVKVHAASVNGFDATVSSGALQGMMEHHFPVVLGKDFSGQVEAVGESVSGLAPGDAVFGVLMREFLGDGTFAEYVVVPEAIGLAKMPSGLDYAEAGALGLAGAAAVAGLDALAPSHGHSLLIAGATGGVGSLAIQLARARAAEVIATARPGEEARFVAELGANETADYTADMEAVLRSRYPEGVDAVLHLAGDAAQLARLVRSGGRLASTLGVGADQLLGPEISATAVMAMPGAPVLSSLGAETAAGRLRVPIQRQYRLEEVPQALGDFGQGTLGKLAVAIA